MLLPETFYTSLNYFQLIHKIFIKICHKLAAHCELITKLSIKIKQYAYQVIDRH